MSFPSVKAADRVLEVRYAVRDILIVAEEARRAGRELLYLNIGDPLQFDHATPPHMIEAVERAMRAGRNGYAPSAGTPEALEAIRRWAARKAIDPVQSLLVGNGASEAIELAFAALVDRGDEVLVPNPGYPLYDAVLAKLEARPLHYTLDEAAGWQPDPDDIEARVGPRTRAIVVINPNNPTGSLTDRDRLERIADVARRHGLVLFSDEIYDELVFDGARHVALAALAPDVPAISFGGLSKVFLAPGWRIGWGVISGPGEAVEVWAAAVHQLARARLCASYPMQAAIPAALDGPRDHVTELLAKLTRRRDLTVERLNAIPGVSCVAPRGAFYAFPRVASGEPDVQLVADCIRETGVVVVHGSGFGPALPEPHFRIVFAPPEQVLLPAYAALARFFEKRLGL